MLVIASRRPPPGTLADHGDQYRPAIQAHDILSPISKRTRVFSTLTGRWHVLLSQLEYAVFCQFERDERVQDIREGLALDLDETMAIAARLGFRHPTGTHPMTTDFIFTVSVRRTVEDVAVYVKPASLLARSMQDINVQAKYWTDKGVPFYAITDREVQAAMRYPQVSWK